MIAMKFTIELDIGLSFFLQAALPQLVTDRATKTHRRGRSKRSYGHCRRRTEIPEAEPLTGGAASWWTALRASGSQTPARPARSREAVGHPRTPLFIELAALASPEAGSRSASVVSSDTTTVDGLRARLASPST